MLCRVVLSCELCICVCVCVRCVSTRTLQIYVFIIPVRADGGVASRAGAGCMAFCQQGMLIFQTIKTKYCILSIQNAMGSLCCFKSEHSVQTQCYILVFVALPKQYFCITCLDLSNIGSDMPSSDKASIL